VRALAFKWQRIIWRCWQDRVVYQEKLYEAALRRSGSPVVGLLKSIEVGKSPVKKTKNNGYPLLTDYLRGEVSHECLPERSLARPNCSAGSFCRELKI
jgi:hypothetical protein